MKRPSIYVKMKVLGAIDVVEGKTRHERIQNVAQMTFLDEEGDSTSVYLADDPDLVLPLQEHRYHGNDQQLTSRQGSDSQGHSRGSARGDQRRVTAFSSEEAEAAQQDGHLPLLHRKGTAASRSDRTHHLLLDSSKSTKCSRRTSANATNGGSLSACSTPTNCGRPTPCSGRMSSGDKPS